MIHINGDSERLWLKRDDGDEFEIAKCDDESTARFLAACVTYCESREYLDGLCESRVLPDEVDWKLSDDARENFSNARQAFLAARDAERKE